MSLRHSSIAARESLPNVEMLYALMYLPFLIAGTSFMVWYELTHKAITNSHTTADTVSAIIIDIGYVSVVDAGVTFGVVEGGVALMILARRWLERMEERREVETAQKVAEATARQQKKWEGGMTAACRRKRTGAISMSRRQVWTMTNRMIAECV